MILETKNKKINLVLRTRKIADVAKKLEGKNFEDVYFKAMSEFDLDALSKIIFTLAENEDKTNAFKNSSEVYDFIDDYMAENNKTYKNIFEEIAEDINEEGFFNSKMSKKELKDKISNPLSSMNMNDVIRNSAEKAITRVAEEQFQGYKA
ncbi:MAG: hypothetical protein UE116_06400 [Clostridia bacterium]|nr:hypothetical protein [Clostridia bacterium]